MQFSPIIRDEIKYKKTKNLVESIDEIVIKPEENSKIPKENIEKKKKRLVIVARDKDFSIVIPKIGANAKVIENIDPYNSSEYQKALTKGVAHAKGTALPNENGNTFIFAHSSDNFYNANRYNSIFYLLNKMEKGDDIYIVYNGKVIPYKVKETKIVDKDKIEYLKNSERKKDNELTLMTCWPPGTTYKRLIVIAEKNK